MGAKRGLASMKQETSGAFLSAVFVDYDNIYLSLKRKSEEAAKRFAKDAALWLKAIETSYLITPTNSPAKPGVRRIVMNRCYGNPVPRRNATDNSTDMNSFPFVRHHFLRAGFEIVDCPPLTAQLKNSSDIRMVMDVRDYLTHDTYFDEFVILSGDADFTPVLHRLRAHARRTVIYANDYTAAPYTAISDGEVREADLITLLLEGRVGDQASPVAGLENQDEAIRRKIIAEVAAAVQASPTPVPLEVLADRAVRALGHERTIGTGWAGAGGFRELLIQSLPEGLRLTEQAPYLVIDSKRHLISQSPALHEQREARAVRPPAAPGGITPFVQEGLGSASLGGSLSPYAAQARPAQAPQQSPYATQAPYTTQAPLQAEGSQPSYAPRGGPAEFQAPLQAPAQAQRPNPGRSSDASASAQAMLRIFEACQAPLLGPSEYRILLEAIAQEIAENNINGAQTYLNIMQRAKDRGLEVRRDDVRFVLDVVSETDPWFEQGASANLFAGRFRNFVVARCRSQGLNLSADELDLIDAWFAGNGPLPTTAALPQRATAQPSFQAQATPLRSAAQPVAQEPRAGDRLGFLDDGQRQVMEQRGATRDGLFQAPTRAGLAQEATQLTAQPEFATDEFPRIVRTRLRG